MSGRRAHAVLLTALCLLGPLLIGLTLFALLSPELFSLARRDSYRLAAYVASGALCVLLLGALNEAVLALRLARGTPGRLRGTLAGFAYAACFTGIGAAGFAVLAIAPQLPNGAMVTLEEAVLLSSSTARWVLLIGLGLAGAGALIALPMTLSAWFLLSRRLRRGLFVLIDIVLVALRVFASLRFVLMPEVADGVFGEATRLVLSLLIGIRVAARLLPYVLDLIEVLDFRALVAARHLRAKKSGFLAAIGFLSILAVSVSSCALTTTLSVMGGFRQDLKRKILGNNAHIVIDKTRARIPMSDDPSALVRTVPEVRGVSPYVSGEVMISSSSNLAGAVLRGIDPDHVAEVSELPKNMRMGSLEYLRHPEKLSNLPPSQLGIGTPLQLPKLSRGNTDSDAKPPQGKGLSAQIEEALRESERAEAEAEAEAEDREPPSDAKAIEPMKKMEPALPGIVVGQELARSLRLYLGDEVNIVTPLGTLGPTGPMPKSRPFRVAGIFFSGMYEYDMKFASVTLEAAQGFLGTGPQLSGVEVTVREPERAQEIASAIAARLPDKQLRVRPWQELNKNLFGALALEKLAMFIALGIAILVASFCIVGTLTLMVQEKGREVAVLKAMGAADRAIVGIFVLEGTMIGVFGSMLGLALGYAVCFAAENFGVHLNPEVYYIDRLPVHIDALEFLTVGISAVLVCLLVTIYPAQLASRLRPVDALRFE